MSHTLPERYSSLIDQAVQAQLVTKSGYIFNSNHEGKFGAVGASIVKIPVRSTNVVVGDYDKVNGMELNIGGTNYIDLPLNHDKAVNEMIDGYTAASLPDDIIAERLTSAAYGLALTIDSLSIKLLESKGTVLENKEALTSETVYNQILDMRTKLSDENIPTTDRWLIVSSEVYGLLLKDTVNFIRQGELSEKLIKSTLLAKNNPELAEGMNTTVEMIAGHPAWCHRVEAWGVNVYAENLTNQYVGATAVKGRKVFGMTISKPESVLIKRKEV